MTVIITVSNMRGENNNMAYEITLQDRIVEFLSVERKRKITSYTTVCRQFVLDRCVKRTLDKLVSSGGIKKLARGYRSI